VGAGVTRTSETRKIVVSGAILNTADRRRELKFPQLRGRCGGRCNRAKVLRLLNLRSSLYTGVIVIHGVSVGGERGSSQALSKANEFVHWFGDRLLARHMQTSTRSTRELYTS
jgi:hypothetical protein